MSSISSPSSSCVSTSSTTRPSPHASTFSSQASGRALGGGGVAAVGELQPAVGAGADAGIFAVAPVDEVVPALGAGHGVVGNLVGRQPGRVADLLRHRVEVGGGVLVGHLQLAGLVERGERRARPRW